MCFFGGFGTLECQSRALSASSAAHCHPHLSRHAIRTPSRPSQGMGGGGAGVLRPVSRGVLPPFPRGTGDGGAVDLRAVSRGVLPLFPLGVHATAARTICGTCRGAYSPCPSRGAGDGGAGSAAWAAGRPPPPFSLQARATAARAFYGRGRGAYSSSSLSGCRRRQRRRSAPCAVGRTPPFPLGVRATAERTDALPRVPSRGLGTAWDPSPSISTETGSGSAGLTPQERDDAAPPASAGPLRGREGTEEREATYARRMQVSLRADDLGNVARGRWRRWWRRRSSPVASAAAGDAAAAGATAEDRGVSR